MRKFVAGQIAMDEALALPPKMLVPMLARLPWDVIRWRRKAGRPLAGFCLGRSNTRLIWMRCLGARQLIAVSENPRVVKIDRRVRNVREHEIQTNIRKARVAARLLGVDAGDPEGDVDIPVPRLKLEGDWIREANTVCAGAGVDGKYIVVSPLSTRAWKDWGLENYRMLLRRVREELSMPVVIAGTRAQGKACRSLAGSGPGCFNVAGKTSPEAYVGLISGASLWLGGDSGGGHVAGALGTPSLSLFFRTDPAQFRPIGPRAEFLSLRDSGRSGPGTTPGGRGNRDEVEVVFAKIKAMLAASAAKA